MRGKKSKRRNYHVTARIDEAFHPTHGRFAVGDTVREAGDPMGGMIIGFTFGNFGNGRVNAEVLWLNGRSTTVPLGRLRKV